MSNNGKSDFFYRTCMEIADSDLDEDFCESIKELAKTEADPDHIMSEMAKRFDKSEIKTAVKNVEV